MQSSRTNYPQETEQSLNQTIQVYLAASHTYDHLSAWASSDEINMPEFAKFFRFCAWRTTEQAERLMDWQTLRGGRFTVSEYKPMIQITELFQYNLEKVVQCAIEIEKKIEYQLRQLYTAARSKDDTATCEMIESKFLKLQLCLVRCMVSHYNGLRQSQNAYHYDRHSMLKMNKGLKKFYSSKSHSKHFPGMNKTMDKACWQDKHANWWPNHDEFHRVWTCATFWY